MNSLKIGIFDLFAYAIPGSIILVISFILYKSSDGMINTNLSNLISMDFNFVSIALLAVLSYLTGFITSILGTLYLILIEKIFTQVSPKKCPNLNQSTKYCLVRELAPNNFKNIEDFNVLKKMSSNIAFIILVYDLLLFIFINNYNIYYFLSGILICCLLTRSAWKFHKYIIIDLDNAVYSLNLDEKYIVRDSLKS
ncbi:MAG: hypothetical protein LBQ22_11140 [Bacteroidales bacterium]|jgi:hypothetical protein|nr:hypothetical protein [Bacteroidales bacterium]